MSLHSGRTGSSSDAVPERCFIGGVATREDEAADELDDDRLRVRGEGGVEVSSDCIARGDGGGRRGQGLRCLEADCGFLRT